MTQMLATPSIVTVAGHPVAGRQWLVDVTMPTEGGVDAATYINRNTGKTRIAHFFGGIEYAHQPIGARRLCPAEKKAPAAPIDASGYRVVSIQGYSQEPYDFGKGRSDLGWTRGLSAWHELGVVESESCLVLHIWTPDPNAIGLPCEVQFRGGGSNYLSAADDRLAGHRACLYNKVYVRVETRNGNLGHYFLPDMDAISGMAGTVNLSLTDALAAWQWLADHGAAFGIDVDNMTATGGSAGGNMALCMTANPAFSDYIAKVAVSSPSAGTDPRFAFRQNGRFQSYQDWFGHRQTLLMSQANRIPSTLDPSRTFADEVSTLGYSDAVRQALPLRYFLALDEGGYDSRSDTPVGYETTRAPTLMWDNKSVFHSNNRDAAIAGAFAAKPLMLTVGQYEASVLGAGLVGNEWFFQEQIQAVARMDAHRFARSSFFNTEWNGTPATPPWGAPNFSRPRLPWLGATEPSAMAFNFGYYHAARTIAKSVPGSYLCFFNGQSQNVPSSGRAGHTDDEPWWAANPLWGNDPPGPTGAEPITIRDLRRADFMAQRRTNFMATGDPNTHHPSPYGFDLFETDLPDTFTPYDPIAKNWNVMGNVGARNARGSPVTVTNVPGFWSGALNVFDARTGVV